MNTSTKNFSTFSLKFFAALVLCLLVRLIPFRAPNVEPILATTMPISRAYGALAGFSFAVLSILLYDVFTHTLGLQTFFTLAAYGVLGVWSASYFQKNSGKIFDYVRFAIYGTLFYDAMTGLTVGPLFFHQSFLQSLMGQIPFTLLHLTGNIIFACTLSPIIYKILTKRRKQIAITSTINILQPKII